MGGQGGPWSPTENNCILGICTCMQYRFGISIFNAFSIDFRWYYSGKWVSQVSTTDPLTIVQWMLLWFWKYIGKYQIIYFTQFLIAKIYPKLVSRGQTTFFLFCWVAFFPQPNAKGKKQSGHARLTQNIGEGWVITTLQSATKICCCSVSFGQPQLQATYA